MSLLVRGHVTRPQHLQTGGHAGTDKGVDEDSSVEEFLPENEGQLILSDDHGHDGGFRFDDAEAHFGEALSHVITDFDETGHHFGMGFKNIEGGQCRGHGGGSGAGAEDECGAVMLDVIDHGALAHHEAAETGKRLAEGAHGHIHLRFQAEGRCGTPSSLADHAHAVGIIDENAGTVFFAGSYECVEFHNLTCGGEHTIGDNQFALVLGEGREKAFQVGHVVMLVPLEIGEGPLGHQVSGDDTGVVVFIRNHVITTLHEGGDDSLGGLIASGKQQTGFLVKEGCQSLFEFVVETDGTRQIPGSRTSRAESRNGVETGLFDGRMRGQSQIIVRSGHDDLATLDADNRTFVFFDSTEIGIISHRLHFVGAGKTSAFVKQIHGGPHSYGGDEMCAYSGTVIPLAVHVEGKEGRGNFEHTTFLNILLALVKSNETGRLPTIQDPFMIAAVTGATGFIGSHVVDALLARGFEVRALIRASSNLRWVKDTAAHLVVADIYDPDSLRPLVENADLVFHVAGVVKARTDEEYHRGNVTATESMLSATRRFAPHVRRFVQVSSGTASGPAASLDRPVREDDPCHPLTRYGISKRKGEETVMAERDVPWTIVRPPAMYGPRDTEVLLVFQTLAKGLNAMIGFDDKRVSLSHCDDLVRGLLLAAESDRAIGEIYHISSERFYSWPEVGAVVGRALGRSVHALRIPHAVVYSLAAVSELIGRIQGKAVTLNLEKARDITQPYWIFDVEKAKRDLGYRQEVSLEEGIASTIAWYRSMGWL